MDSERDAASKLAERVVTRNEKAICEQLDFYFSDANMRRDKYLRSVMLWDGSVALSELLGFRRIAGLSASADDLVAAVASSLQLELTADGTRVRRCMPFTDVPCDTNKCTLYVEGLSTHVEHDAVRLYFERFGPVAHVSLPRFRVSRKLKGFGFVEFVHPHAMQAAVSAHDVVAGDCVACGGSTAGVAGASSRLIAPRADVLLTVSAGSRLTCYSKAAWLSIKEAVRPIRLQADIAATAHGPLGVSGSNLSATDGFDFMPGCLVRLTGISLTSGLTFQLLRRALAAGGRVRYIDCPALHAGPRAAPAMLKASPREGVSANKRVKGAEWSGATLEPPPRPAVSSRLGPGLSALARMSSANLAAMATRGDVGGEEDLYLLVSAPAASSLAREHRQSSFVSWRSQSDSVEAEATLTAVVRFFSAEDSLSFFRLLADRGGVLRIGSCAILCQPLRGEDEAAYWRGVKANQFEFARRKAGGEAFADHFGTARKSDTTSAAANDIAASASAAAATDDASAAAVDASAVAGEAGLEPGAAAAAGDAQDDDELFLASYARHHRRRRVMRDGDDASSSLLEGAGAESLLSGDAAAAAMLPEEAFNSEPVDVGAAGPDRQQRACTEDVGAAAPNSAGRPARAVVLGAGKRSRQQFESVA